MRKNLLSVIVPAYNEEVMVETTASVISRILEDAHIPCELLFVDDGKDKTWFKITAPDKQKTRPIRGGRMCEISK